MCGAGGCGGTRADRDGLRIRVARGTGAVARDPARVCGGALRVVGAAHLLWSGDQRAIARRSPHHRADARRCRVGRPVRAPHPGRHDRAPAQDRARGGHRRLLDHQRAQHHPAPCQPGRRPRRRCHQRCAQHGVVDERTTARDGPPRASPHAPGVPGDARARSSPAPASSPSRCSRCRAATTSTSRSSSSPRRRGWLSASPSASAIAIGSASPASVNWSRSCWPSPASWPSSACSRPEGQPWPGRREAPLASPA